MDYGQTTQPDKEPVFSAPSAGEEINWNSPIERDPRHIGNSAINSPESPLNQPENAPISSTEQIVSIEMPPGTEPETPPENNATPEPATPFDKSRIKTGKSLSKDSAQEINKVIGKLNRDGDVASFYDTARDMMEANLENSFNRKLES